jgi:hypothetical protein
MMVVGLSHRLGHQKMVLHSSDMANRRDEVRLLQLDEQILALRY